MQPANNIKPRFPRLARKLPLGPSTEQALEVILSTNEEYWGELLCIRSNLNDGVVRTLQGEFLMDHTACIFLWVHPNSRQPTTKQEATWYMSYDAFLNHA